MKRILCCLMVLLLCATAFAEAPAAETQATAVPNLQIELVTPSPMPEAIGEVFSSEDLIVTLPAGLMLLESDALEAYDAALQADYPRTARTVFAAVNGDQSAAVSFSIADSAVDSAKAAQEAAGIVLGSGASISEAVYGENKCASFSCAIGEQVYNLYFLSSGSKLLVVGASGLEEKQIETMLAGLIF